MAERPTWRSYESANSIRQGFSTRVDARNWAANLARELTQKRRNCAEIRKDLTSLILKGLIETYSAALRSKPAPFRGFRRKSCSLLF